MAVNERAWRQALQGRLQVDDHDAALQRGQARHRAQALRNDVGVRRELVVRQRLVTGEAEDRDGARAEERKFFLHARGRRRVVASPAGPGRVPAWPRAQPAGPWRPRSGRSSAGWDVRSWAAGRVGRRASDSSGQKATLSRAWTWQRFAGNVDGFDPPLARRAGRTPPLQAGEAVILAVRLSGGA